MVEDSDTLRKVLLNSLKVLNYQAMEKELAHVQAQGLNGWLIKPPNLGQLAQVVAQALGEGSGEQD